MSIALPQIQELSKRMQASIIGQPAVVERLLLTLLCNGNVLVEGLPGLAKTRAVKSLAQNMEAAFSRKGRRQQCSWCNHPTSLP